MKEHKARMAKAKQIEAGASIATRQPTATSTTTKLPPIVVEIDDVGTITRRKVPFVRPVGWDVWDKNSPSFTYQTLGLVMRNSLFPGQMTAVSLTL